MPLWLTNGLRLLRRMGEDPRNLLLDLSTAALRTFHGGMPVVLSKRLVRREPLSTLAALEFVGSHPFLLLFGRINPKGLKKPFRLLGRAATPHAEPGQIPAFLGPPIAAGSACS